MVKAKTRAGKDKGGCLVGKKVKATGGGCKVGRKGVNFKEKPKAKAPAPAPAPAAPKKKKKKLILRPKEAKGVMKSKAEKKARIQQKVRDLGKEMVAKKKEKKKDFTAKPKPKKTAGEKLTGLSAAQMNAMSPAELFGKLPVRVASGVVLNPKRTGVKVGKKTTAELVEKYRTYRTPPTMVVRKEWSDAPQGANEEIYTAASRKAMGEHRLRDLLYKGQHKDTRKILTETGKKFGRLPNVKGTPTEQLFGVLSRKFGTPFDEMIRNDIEKRMGNTVSEKAYQGKIKKYKKLHGNLTYSLFDKD